MAIHSRQWFPLSTQGRSRPEPGQLIAHQHAVWRVAKVEDTELDEADREVWLERGMPDLGRWPARPYKLTLDWEGGAEPPWASQGIDAKRGTIRIPAGRSESWQVYRQDRWPQCSCCGEPVPCRAELEDDQVTVGLTGSPNSKPSRLAAAGPAGNSSPPGRRASPTRATTSSCPGLRHPASTLAATASTEPAGMKSGGSRPTRGESESSPGPTAADPCSSTEMAAANASEGSRIAGATPPMIMTRTPPATSRATDAHASAQERAIPGRAPNRDPNASFRPIANSARTQSGREQPPG